MLRNYFISAIRNLLKYKLYSFINIAGLAVGMACCVLILLFVRYELSYDSWLADSERIYRLHTTFNIPGRPAMRIASSARPARAALEKDFAEIESAVRLFIRSWNVSRDNTVFEQDIVFADKEFFSVFDLPVVAGERKKVLADNRSILLSQTVARKYFGTEQAVGKTVTVCCFGDERKVTFRVAGILADVPENSHLTVPMLARLDLTRYGEGTRFLQPWSQAPVYTYIKLKPGTDADAVRARLPEFSTNNLPTMEFGEMGQLDLGDLVHFDLMAIRDIHLRAVEQVEARSAIKRLGDISTIYAFSAVALLILLIACINFTNLATSRSMQRAREIAMRKVVGASRVQLIVQFLGESVLVAGIALIVGLSLVEIALPWYSAFLQVDLGLSGQPYRLYQERDMLLWLLALAVVVGVAAGLYPALYLSRVRPAAVLRANRSSERSGSARLRAILVITQFAISITLVVSTAVVWGQTHYAKQMDPGFHRENMLIVRGLWHRQAERTAESIERELVQRPDIVAVTRSAAVPTDDYDNNTFVTVPGSESGESILLSIRPVDYDFFATYGVVPKAGRVFSPQHRLDDWNDESLKSGQQAAGTVVINERAVKRLGFRDADSAVGQILRVLVSQTQAAPMTIIGVVPDIQLRSVHHRIQPIMYFRDANNFAAMTIRFRTDDVPALLTDVERVWRSALPSLPFEYQFLDQRIAAQYRAEEQRAAVFAAFSVLAIFIACLGLYGLTSFTVERRTKEIGIRKVLGASVLDIVRLLFWQLSRPILIANLIAWPIAYWIMRDWLNGFSRAISLSPMFFIGTGLGALVIAWLTVAAHTLRVARANPIHALRYE
ncbi:MAG: ABC transporter permease [Proteobacteria bacterium]|nr:ABC transporter permease [Pseudomonadota bacterium]